MTDIRKAAEKTVRGELGMADDEPNGATGYVTRLAFAYLADGFVRGAEWMREQAAQAVERAHDEIPYTPGPGESAVANPPMRRISDIAAAIRKIGASDG